MDFKVTNVHAAKLQNITMHGATQGQLQECINQLSALCRTLQMAPLNTIKASRYRKHLVRLLVTRILFSDR